MTEPTITCPKCKTEIKLTESLAAPLIESTRQQFEQQLAQKDSDIAQREKAIREQEKKLTESSNKLDQQVASQVEEQLKKDRSRIATEETRKAKLAVATDLEQKAQELADLEEVLKIRDEKLAEAQKAQLELIKKKRELDDARREIDLTVEKRVQEGLTATREQAKKEAEEALSLKVAEKDHTIAAMQKKSRPLTMIIALHQEERALDVARATNGKLYILGWQKTQDDTSDRPSVKKIVLLAPGYHPLKPEAIFGHGKKTKT